MSYKNEEHKEIAEKLRLSVKKEATEETVKIRLIQPFFNKVLGWPLDKIVGEYVVSKGKGEKVDYALFGEDGQPKYLIEAKSPSKNLDKFVPQLVRYMKLTNVRVGFLTNGEKYEVITKENGEYNITNSFSIDNYPSRYEYKTSNTPVYLSPQNYFENIISRLPDSLSEKLSTIIALQPLSKQDTPIHMSFIIDSAIIRDFYNIYRNLGINITTIKQTRNGYKVDIKKDSDVIVLYAPYKKSLPIENILRDEINIQINDGSGLPEKTPLLVLTSPKFGMFDEYEPTSEQLVLSSFELSNFHFVKTIISQIQEDGRPDKLGSIEKSDRMYVKGFTLPELTSDTEEEIQRYYRELCRRHSSDTFPITLREKEVIKTLSRLKTLVSSDNEIKVETSESVYSIIKYGLEVSSLEEDTGEIDASKIETSTPTSKRNRIRFVEDLIEDLEGEYDDEGIPFEVIVEQAEEEGFNGIHVEEDIKKLSKRGDVITPTNETVRTV